MKLTRSLLLFCSLISFTRLYPQPVYAQVSAKRVQVGTPFEFAIVMTVNANNVTPPAFRDLDVVSGPNQSSSVQYANGVMSQQLIVSYGLVARKEGKITIGPAIVTAGGQKYETQPVVIEATKAAPGGDGTQGRAGDDIFIRTTVSKNRFYLGEQVTIIQKVYSRNQIVGYQKSVPPAYDGFYSQPLESPTKGQLVMENVDGVNYYTHEIFRTAVIASKAGKIVINPMEVTPVVRRAGGKPRSLFEQLLGGAGYEDVPVDVRSRPVTVEVLPLPEEGKPESFNGAVGNFTTRVDLNRNEVKANDALTLRFTVTGKGNLKLLPAPPLKLPEHFESYEPKVSESASSKTFEYLIIPRKAGDYTIDHLDFSYFNLDTKKYVTVPSPQLRVKVLPPDPGSAGAQVFVPQNQVKETQNDIRYIKKGDFVLSKREEEFFNSPLHIALMIFPVTALGAGLVMRRRYVRANSDLAMVRERKAGAMAKKQLSRAAVLVRENKRDEFYAEILTALNNYLSYKLRIPAADLSRDTIHHALRSKGTEETLITALDAQLEAAEFARYAPAAASADLNGVYQETAAVITRLEQQLAKAQTPLKPKAA